MDYSKQKELLEKGVILTIGDNCVFVKAELKQPGPGILSQLTPYFQEVSLEDLLSGDFEIDESKKGKFESSGKVYCDDQIEIHLL